MGSALDVGALNPAFQGRVMAAIPGGGNLDACLTCNLCSSRCPASGLHGMDPRKFVRMVALGLDELALSTPWAWCCTQCMRCSKVCPMEVDIPRLVWETRASWPREERPKGIRGSCDFQAERGSAMGISPDDFKFVVEDVLNEVRANQPGWEDLQAPMDKQGAGFYFNQNSREPVTEPEEMVPLWKIFHLGGIDWTYSSQMWGAENYCMFLGDNEKWEHIVRTQAKVIDDLGCHTFINTE